MQPTMRCARLTHTTGRGEWVPEGPYVSTSTMALRLYVYNEIGENVQDVGEGSAGRFSMLLCY